MDDTHDGPASLGAPRASGPHGPCATSFVARVREQMQTRYGGDDGTRGSPPDDASSTTPTVDALVRAHGYASSNESRCDNRLPPCRAHPHLSSFLTRAEAALGDHYDRISQREDTLPTLGAFAPDEPAIQRVFRARHGVSLDVFVDQLERVVQGVVEDYAAYFEAEDSIVAAAARCDRVNAWTRLTREMLKANPMDEADDRRSDGVEARDAVSADVSPQTDVEATCLTAMLGALPAWGPRFARARALWQQLETSRAALQRCEALLGGRLGCRICYEAEVNVVLVPCGHIMCATCADKVSQCPYCNAPFYSRQTMYLS